MFLIFDILVLTLSFKRLKTFLKKVSFPKHKDSERWKVVIPRQSHSLKTPYYCTSSSQTWLSDKHSYTYIKRDEQQVRALEKKGMKERHTLTCMVMLFRQQQLPAATNFTLSKWRSLYQATSAQGSAHHLPPHHPAACMYLPLQIREEKRRSRWSHPKRACGLMRQMTVSVHRRPW